MKWADVEEGKDYAIMVWYMDVRRATVLDATPRHGRVRYWKTKKEERVRGDQVLMLWSDWRVNQDKWRRRRLGTWEYL